MSEAMLLRFLTTTSWSVIIFRRDVGHDLLTGVHTHTRLVSVGNKNNLKEAQSIGEP